VKAIVTLKRFIADSLASLTPKTGGGKKIQRKNNTVEKKRRRKK